MKIIPIFSFIRVPTGQGKSGKVRELKVVRESQGISGNLIVSQGKSGKMGNMRFIKTNFTENVPFSF